MQYQSSLKMVQKQRNMWERLEYNLISFELWCWRRMKKICWTDLVRNEEVLLRVKEQRNILHEISKRKANWIGHILRRNCLLQRVIPYPTAFPYGNGMVLHFYQQQESSTTKTVHKVINKGLKTYV